MILFLRFLFTAVIVAMLGVTTWASLGQSLGDFARGPVIRDPWVIATLFDAYFAFIAFYVWVAWKERSAGARALWFVSIILLGNIAIAAYMLDELFSVSAKEPAREALEKIFARRNPGGLVLPGILTALAVAVYLLA
jgi:hypothetical protein